MSAAMKLDPHLPRLPSIGELLEHPHVKGMVARINRSTLAHRAAGFLEELRSSVNVRKGRVDIPSVTHLAERLARRLMGEPSVRGPVINATGVVVGDPALAPPLADAAVNAMMQATSEFCGGEAAIRNDVERHLVALTGAEAALAVVSFDAALALALSAAAANRELLVCGGGEAISAIDWRWQAARSGALLRSCAASGAALCEALNDKPQVAAIVRSPEADGEVALAEMAMMARQRGACVIDAAPLAGLLNAAAYDYESLETLKDRLEGGADLVVADGAGLLGGPACGLIVGRRRFVQAAAEHPLARLFLIHAIVAAGLYSTLVAYRDDSEPSAVFSVPVWQLLSAPRDNLKHRAERLAPLMAEIPAIDSAEAREAPSAWRGDNVTKTAPSWSIVVRPRGGDAASIAERLHHGQPLIAGRLVNGAVRFDLRSVFPRWDQQLVAALEAAIA
jgi:L-seryl-tRNA(Ser) seleniumtransferase